MDAVLATRGWGAEEFRLASPRLLDAARWALIAEKAVPLFQEQRQIADTVPEAGADPDRWRNRLIAIEYVKHVKPWLFPDG